MPGSEGSAQGSGGWLDLRLPSKSPVQTFDGLNRRPVAGRIRVLAERTGGWTSQSSSVQFEGDVMLREPSTFVTREIYTRVTPPMQSDAAVRVASRIFGE